MANKAAEVISVEPIALVHVDPATLPTISAVMVTIPLLVTAIAPDIFKIGLMVRLALAEIILAVVILKLPAPLPVTEPNPEIKAFVPLSVNVVVPIANVPFTVMVVAADV